MYTLQPFNAAQQAWPASHWQQHTRRKRQHKFCPSNALEPQQEQLIKCQRWVCEQDDAAVPEEQRCLQLELSAAYAAEDTGLSTDGQLYAPQSCSNDIAPTPSYSSSVDHTGAGTGCSSTPRHADTAAPCASRGSVRTTSSCSPEAVQNAGPCAAVLALPAHATQPCQEQQQQHDQEQVPVQAAASACSAESAAIDVDDVSAQKAAAQARFAQQQRRQAASSKTAPSTRFDQDLLQQEQDRLLQPGYQTRMFACALLSNLLCCLVLMAAKVRAVIPTAPCITCPAPDHILLSTTAIVCALAGAASPHGVSMQIVLWGYLACSSSLSQCTCSCILALLHKSHTVTLHQTHQTGCCYAACWFCRDLWAVWWAAAPYVCSGPCCLPCVQQWAGCT